MKSKSTQIHFLRIILLLNSICYMKATDCLNCSTHFKGNYCPYCGQKATVAKLTWEACLKSLFISLRMQNIVSCIPRKN